MFETVATFPTELREETVLVTGGSGSSARTPSPSFSTPGIACGQAHQGHLHRGRTCLSVKAALTGEQIEVDRFRWPGFDLSWREFALGNGAVGRR